MAGPGANPYSELPPRAFWRRAVAERGAFGLDELWRPRFAIGREDRMVTFGSCFAQHIGRALKARGFAWHDAEPAPETFTAEDERAFGYGLFSARTGNIYTTSMLLQWVRWALGRGGSKTREAWPVEGCFHDPFRPRLEPGGFASREELLRSRHRAVLAFRECIRTARYFVFTLGLTESWIGLPRGLEYPLCPGTAGGTFRPDVHRFVNRDYPAVLGDLGRAMDLMREVNDGLRFILSVSPVPLAATASGEHVMVATTASKSILRAVTAALVAMRDDVDYFPAYELVAGPAARAMFFAADGRTVVRQGVDYVMDHFFRALGEPDGAARPHRRPAAVGEGPREAVCEEELLGAFGG